MPRLLLTQILVIALFLSGCGNYRANLVEVPSRPGIMQGFIHIMPEEPPVASVILFAGGHGELKLTSAHRMEWGENNFLVRSRNKFAKQGFQVAVIDAPKDYIGFLLLKRSTNEHFEDIKAVSDYLRSQADVPVWIIGTSMGTDSVAYLAVNFGEAFDGVVFTASANQTPLYELQNVTIPAMALHNKKDGCGNADPGNARLIYDRLENSPRREFEYVSSRQTKIVYASTDGALGMDECRAMTPHGFLGIESEVVELIANFIKGNQS